MYCEEAIFDMTNIVYIMIGVIERSQESSSYIKNWHRLYSFVMRGGSHQDGEYSLLMRFPPPPPSPPHILNAVILLDDAWPRDVWAFVGHAYCHRGETSTNIYRRGYRIYIYKISSIKA